MLRRFIHFTRPPEGWSLAAILLTGAFCGLGAYLVYISKAPSYLSDKPETCINCHIMVPEYKTWTMSSHGEKVSCNDCHVPHNNVFAKYYFKAKDGMRHATMFTLRREPQVIFMHEAGQGVVQENCIHCHEHTLRNDRSERFNPLLAEHRTDRTCWECHREVPHGRVKSLNSVPNARVPLPGSPVPDWLTKTLEK